MGVVKKLRREFGYEINIPRCASCMHYANERIFMFNSLPRIKPAWCKLGMFSVQPTSICNNWVSKTGNEVLCKN